MSIIEEYEQDTLITYSGSKKKNSFSNGIEPIFKKNKIEFTPEDSIVNFLVSNDVFLLYTANRKLIRYNPLSNDRSTFNIKDYLTVKSEYVKLHQMFHSPSGDHSILSFSYSDGTSLAENFYLCRKMHTLVKSKSHILSAVAWNHKNEETKQKPNTTSTILIGTSKGLIFETELVYREDNKWVGNLLNQVTVEEYWKQVYDLKLNEGECNTNITAIEFYSLSLKTNEKLSFVLVTTNNTIYQFVSKSNEDLNLINLFSRKSEKIETPGNLGFSKLDVFYEVMRNKINSNKPKSIGWLVEPGVYYAFLDLNKAIKEKQVINFNKIIAYREPKSKEKPVSMVITKYHTLVLFKNMLKVMCNINGQVIMEDKFLPTYGKAVNISKDQFKDTIWACSEMALYKYTVDNEDRDIISIYLQQNDFTNAKMVAANDKQKLNQIYSKEAQFYFDKGDYLTSAQLYAQSNQPFEEVSLKFMNLDDKSILKEYLTYKLDALPDKEITQINLLIAWLVEIFLKDLYVLRQEKLFDDEKYELVKAEFECILNNDKVKRSVKSTKKIIYDLMTNQSDDKSLIYFARAIEDYEYLIEYFLRLNEHTEVLNVLKDSKDKNLIYRFAPVLIKSVPKELIDILIENYKDQKFDFKQLLPTLISNASNEQQNIFIMKQLIRYLEHCIYKLSVRDEIVFNYLITIYGEIIPEKIDGLLDFIKENEINFDLRFTLRLCHKIELYKACVTLYTMMELYEDAFDYAMLFDLELAKQIANLPAIDKETKKKLWLKIAKHIISQNDDLQHLSTLLNECQHLTVEDILPFFPDVLIIDLFREPICTSLKGYNIKINELRKEIQEISESIEQVREEIRFSKNDHCFVRVIDVCSLCKTNVLNKEFYQFPCKHQFHVDCLENKLSRLLDSDKLNRLTKIKQELNDLNRTVQLSALNNDDLLVEKERLLMKYDEIVCSECIYCGELMINTIDKPLIESDSDQEGWD